MNSPLKHSPNQLEACTHTVNQDRKHSQIAVAKRHQSDQEMNRSLNKMEVAVNDLDLGTPGLHRSFQDLGHFVVSMEHSMTQLEHDVDRICNDNDVGDSNENGAPAKGDNVSDLSTDRVGGTEHAERMSNHNYVDEDNIHSASSSRTNALGLSSGILDRTGRFDRLFNHSDVSQTDTNSASSSRPRFDNLSTNRPVWTAHVERIFNDNAVREVYRNSAWSSGRHVHKLGTKWLDDKGRYPRLPKGDASESSHLLKMKLPSHSAHGLTDTSSNDGNGMDGANRGSVSARETHVAEIDRHTVTGSGRLLGVVGPKDTPVCYSQGRTECNGIDGTCGGSVSPTETLVAETDQHTLTGAGRFLGASRQEDSDSQGRTESNGMDETSSGWVSPTETHVVERAQHTLTGAGRVLGAAGLKDSASQASTKCRLTHAQPSFCPAPHVTARAHRALEGQGQDKEELESVGNTPHVSLVTYHKTDHSTEIQPTGSLHTAPDGTRTVRIKDMTDASPTTAHNTDHSSEIPSAGPCHRMSDGTSATRFNKDTADVSPSIALSHGPDKNRTLRETDQHHEQTHTTTPKRPSTPPAGHENDTARNPYRQQSPQQQAEFNSVEQASRHEKIYPETHNELSVSSKYKKQRENAGDKQGRSRGGESRSADDTPRQPAAPQQSPTQRAVLNDGQASRQEQQYSENEDPPSRTHSPKQMIKHVTQHNGAECSIEASNIEQLCAGKQIAMSASPEHEKHIDSVGDKKDSKLINSHSVEENVKNRQSPKQLAAKGGQASKQEQRLRDAGRQGRELGQLHQGLGTRLGRDELRVSQCRQMELLGGWTSPDKIHPQRAPAHGGREVMQCGLCSFCSSSVLVALGRLLRVIGTASRDRIEKLRAVSAVNTLQLMQDENPSGELLGRQTTRLLEGDVLDSLIRVLVHAKTTQSLLTAGLLFRWMVYARVAFNVSGEWSALGQTAEGVCVAMNAETPVRCRVRMLVSSALRVLLDAPHSTNVLDTVGRLHEAHVLTRLWLTLFDLCPSCHVTTLLNICRVIFLLGTTDIDKFPGVSREDDRPVNWVLFRLKWGGGRERDTRVVLAVAMMLRLMAKKHYLLELMMSKEVTWCVLTELITTNNNNTNNNNTTSTNTTSTNSNSNTTNNTSSSNNSMEPDSSISVETVVCGVRVLASLCQHNSLYLARHMDTGRGVDTLFAGLHGVIMAHTFPLSVKMEAAFILKHFLLHEEGERLIQRKFSWLSEAVTRCRDSVLAVILQDVVLRVKRLLGPEELAEVKRQVWSVLDGQQGYRDLALGMTANLVLDNTLLVSEPVACKAIDIAWRHLMSRDLMTSQNTDLVLSCLRLINSGLTVRATQPTSNIMQHDALPHHLKGPRYVIRIVMLATTAEDTRLQHKAGVVLYWILKGSQPEWMAEVAVNTVIPLIVCFLRSSHESLCRVALAVVCRLLLDFTSDDLTDALSTSGVPRLVRDVSTRSRSATDPFQALASAVHTTLKTQTLDTPCLHALEKAVTKCEESFREKPKKICINRTSHSTTSTHCSMTSDDVMFGEESARRELTRELCALEAKDGLVKETESAIVCEGDRKTLTAEEVERSVRKDLTDTDTYLDFGFRVVCKACVVGEARKHAVKYFNREATFSDFMRSVQHEFHWSPLRLRHPAAFQRLSAFVKTQLESEREAVQRRPTEEEGDTRREVTPLYTEPKGEKQGQTSVEEITRRQTEKQSSDTEDTEGEDVKQNETRIPKARKETTDEERSELTNSEQTTTHRKGEDTPEAREEDASLPIRRESVHDVNEEEHHGQRQHVQNYAVVKTPTLQQSYPPARVALSDSETSGSSDQGELSTNRKRRRQHKKKSKGGLNETEHRNTENIPPNETHRLFPNRRVAQLQTSTPRYNAPSKQPGYGNLRYGLENVSNRVAQLQTSTPRYNAPSKQPGHDHLRYGLENVSDRVAQLKTSTPRYNALSKQPDHGHFRDGLEVVSERVTQQQTSTPRYNALSKQPDHGHFTDGLEGVSTSMEVKGTHDRAVCFEDDKEIINSPTSSWQYSSDEEDEAGAFNTVPVEIDSDLLLHDVDIYNYTLVESAELSTGFEFEECAGLSPGVNQLPSQRHRQGLDNGDAHFHCQQKVSAEIRTQFESEERESFSPGLNKLTSQCHHHGLDKHQDVHCQQNVSADISTHFECEERESLSPGLNKLTSPCHHQGLDKDADCHGQQKDSSGENQRAAVNADLSQKKGGGPSIDSAVVYADQPDKLCHHADLATLSTPGVVETLHRHSHSERGAVPDINQAEQVNIHHFQSHAQGKEPVASDLTHVTAITDMSSLPLLEELSESYSPSKRSADQDYSLREDLAQHDSEMTDNAEDETSVDTDQDFVDDDMEHDPDRLVTSATARDSNGFKTDHMLPREGVKESISEVQQSNMSGKGSFADDDVEQDGDREESKTQGEGKIDLPTEDHMLCKEHVSSGWENMSVQQKCSISSQASSDAGKAETEGRERDQSSIVRQMKEADIPKLTSSYNESFTIQENNILYKERFDAVTETEGKELDQSSIVQRMNQTDRPKPTFPDNDSFTVQQDNVLDKESLGTGKDETGGRELDRSSIVHQMNEADIPKLTSPYDESFTMQQVNIVDKESFEAFKEETEGKELNQREQHMAETERPKPTSPCDESFTMQQSILDKENFEGGKEETEGKEGDQRSPVQQMNVTDRPKLPSPYDDSFTVQQDNIVDKESLHTSKAEGRERDQSSLAQLMNETDRPKPNSPDNDSFTVQQDKIVDKESVHTSKEEGRELDQSSIVPQMDETDRPKLTSPDNDSFTVQQDNVLDKESRGTGKDETGERELDQSSLAQQINETDRPKPPSPYDDSFTVQQDKIVDKESVHTSKEEGRELDQSSIVPQMDETDRPKLTSPDNDSFTVQQDIVLDKESRGTGKDETGGRELDQSSIAQLMNGTDRPKPTSPDEESFTDYRCVHGVNVSDCEDEDDSMDSFLTVEATESSVMDFSTHSSDDDVFVDNGDLQRCVSHGVADEGLGDQMFHVPIYRDSGRKDTFTIADSSFTFNNTQRNFLETGDHNVTSSKTATDLRSMYEDYNTSLADEKENSQQKMRVSEGDNPNDTLLTRSTNMNTVKSKVGARSSSENYREKTTHSASTWNVEHRSPDNVFETGKSTQLRTISATLADLTSLCDTVPSDGQTRLAETDKVDQRVHAKRGEEMMPELASKPFQAVSPAENKTQGEQSIHSALRDRTGESQSRHSTTIQSTRANTSDPEEKASQILSLGKISVTTEEHVTSHVIEENHNFVIPEIEHSAEDPTVTLKLTEDNVKALDLETPVQQDEDVSSDLNGVNTLPFTQEETAAKEEVHTQDARDAVALDLDLEGSTTLQSEDSELTTDRKKYRSPHKTHSYFDNDISTEKLQETKNPAITKIAETLEQESICFKQTMESTKACHIYTPDHTDKEAATVIRADDNVSNKLIARERLRAGADVDRKESVLSLNLDQISQHLLNELLTADQRRSPSALSHASPARARRVSNETMACTVVMEIGDKTLEDIMLVVEENEDEDVEDFLSFEGGAGLEFFGGPVQLVDNDDNDLVAIAAVAEHSQDLLRNATRSSAARDQVKPVTSLDKPQSSMTGKELPALSLQQNGEDSKHDEVTGHVALGDRFRPSENSREEMTAADPQHDLDCGMHEYSNTHEHIDSFVEYVYEPAAFPVGMKPILSGYDSNPSDTGEEVYQSAEDDEDKESAFFEEVRRADTCMEDVFYTPTEHRDRPDDGVLAETATNLTPHTERMDSLQDSQERLEAEDTMETYYSIHSTNDSPYSHTPSATDELIGSREVDSPQRRESVQSQDGGNETTEISMQAASDVSPSQYISLSAILGQPTRKKKTPERGSFRSESQPRKTSVEQVRVKQSLEQRVQQRSLSEKSKARATHSTQSFPAESSGGKPSGTQLLLAAKHRSEFRTQSFPPPGIMTRQEDANRKAFRTKDEKNKSKPTKEHCSTTRDRTRSPLAIRAKSRHVETQSPKRIASEGDNHNTQPMSPQLAGREDSACSVQEVTQSRKKKMSNTGTYHETKTDGQLPVAAGHREREVSDAPKVDDGKSPSSLQQTRGAILTGRVSSGSHGPQVEHRPRRTAKSLETDCNPKRISQGEEPEREAQTTSPREKKDVPILKADRTTQAEIRKVSLTVKKKTKLKGTVRDKGEDDKLENSPQSERGERVGRASTNQSREDGRKMSTPEQHEARIRAASTNEGSCRVASQVKVPFGITRGLPSRPSPGELTDSKGAHAAEAVALKRKHPAALDSKPQQPKSRRRSAPVGATAGAREQACDDLSGSCSDLAGSSERLVVKQPQRTNTVSSSTRKASTTDPVKVAKHAALRPMADTAHAAAVKKRPTSTEIKSSSPASRSVQSSGSSNEAGEKHRRRSEVTKTRKSHSTQREPRRSTGSCSLSEEMIPAQKTEIGPEELSMKDSSGRKAARTSSRSSLESLKCVDVEDLLYSSTLSLSKFMIQDDTDSESLHSLSLYLVPGQTDQSPTEREQPRGPESLSDNTRDGRQGSAAQENSVKSRKLSTSGRAAEKDMKEVLVGTDCVEPSETRHVSLTKEHVEETSACEMNERTKDDPASKTGRKYKLTPFHKGNHVQQKCLSQKTGKNLLATFLSDNTTDLLFETHASAEVKGEACGRGDTGTLQKVHQHATRSEHPERHGAREDKEHHASHTSSQLSQVTRETSDVQDPDRTKDLIENQPSSDNTSKNEDGELSSENTNPSAVRKRLLKKRGKKIVLSLREVKDDGSEENTKMNTTVFADEDIKMGVTKNSHDNIVSGHCGVRTTTRSSETRQEHVSCEETSENQEPTAVFKDTPLVKVNHDMDGGKESTYSVPEHQQHVSCEKPVENQECAARAVPKKKHRVKVKHDLDGGEEITYFVSDHQELANSEKSVEDNECTPPVVPKKKHTIRVKHDFDGGEEITYSVPKPPLLKKKSSFKISLKKKKKFKKNDSDDDAECFSSDSASTTTSLSSREAEPVKKKKVGTSSLQKLKRAFKGDGKKKKAETAESPQTGGQEGIETQRLALKGDGKKQAQEMAESPQTGGQEGIEQQRPGLKGDGKKQAQEMVESPKTTEQDRVEKDSLAAAVVDVDETFKSNTTGGCSEKDSTKTEANGNDDTEGSPMLLWRQKVLDCLKQEERKRSENECPFLEPSDQNTADSNVNSTVTIANNIFEETHPEMVNGMTPENSQNYDGLCTLAGQSFGQNSFDSTAEEVANNCDITSKQTKPPRKPPRTFSQRSLMTDQSLDFDESEQKTRGTFSNQDNERVDEKGEDSPQPVPGSRPTGRLYAIRESDGDPPEHSAKELRADVAFPESESTHNQGHLNGQLKHTPATQTPECRDVCWQGMPPSTVVPPIGSSPKGRKRGLGKLLKGRAHKTKK